MKPVCKSCGQEMDLRTIGLLTLKYTDGHVEKRLVSIYECKKCGTSDFEPFPFKAMVIDKETGEVHETIGEEWKE